MTEQAKIADLIVVVACCMAVALVLVGEWIAPDIIAWINGNPPVMVAR